MANEIKSITGIIEQSQLSGIVTDIVKLLHDEDTAVTNFFNTKIGELGNKSEADGETPAVPHTVKSFVEAAIAAVNGDAEALEARVKANEDAITLLNNNSETEGSVDYKIAQAFNDFATKVSDDKVVNTFKEMIDYVAAHGTEYANLAALVGSLPADAGVTTVVAYIEKLAAAAQKEADDRLDVIEGEGEGSIKKAVKDLAEGAVADNTAAIATEQERAEGVEGDIIEAINANALATDEQIAAIKALIK